MAVRINTMPIIVAIIIDKYSPPYPDCEMCLPRIPQYAQIIPIADIYFSPSITNKIPRAVPTAITTIDHNCGDSPKRFQFTLTRRTDILAMVAAVIQPRYKLNPHIHTFDKKDAEFIPIDFSILTTLKLDVIIISEIRSPRINNNDNQIMS